MNAHVIGAGMAGLTVAVSLAKVGYKVTIWEKEELPCVFASSRNAAIFRTYESDPVISYLVKRNYLHILKARKEGVELLNETGLIVDPLENDYYEEPFLKKNPGAGRLNSEKRTIVLPGGGEFSGLYISGNGVIDIHALQEYFLKQAKEKGVVLHFQKRIISLVKQGDRIVRFQLNGDQTVEMESSDIIVNASGSWARDLFEKNGLAAAPLVPHKRHLYFIKTKDDISNLPVIWDEKKDIYFRPEGPGFIATHCDQRPTGADDFSAVESETGNFLRALTEAYPFFKDYYISRYWACLRTFPLDNLPIIGFDKHQKNVLWFTGFGGRGMSIALAAGEFLEQKLEDGTIYDDVKNPLSPSRFY
ncbi:MAG: FAD-dependent oxidoreductase [Leptospirales bacterium]